jgi:hypothetical protein
VGGVVRAVVLVVLASWSASCGGINLLSREYEYEEEIYLDTDGSAAIVVNASIASLVALRGLALDVSVDAVVDSERIESLYTSPVSRVTRVSRPWRRDGRTFVQVRVETDDITKLSAVQPFEWSRYTFESAPGQSEGQTTLTYRQRVTDLEVDRGSVGPRPNWTGQELVAVRLHLPSKIAFHNAPSRRVERGNILSWEQTLGGRLNGDPLEIEVRMDGQSILYRTLGIFAMTLAAAVLLLAGAAYWVKRKGHDRSRLLGRRID